MLAAALPSLRPLLLPALIAAAVGIAIGAGGGFDPGARLAFAALAGTSLLVAIRDDRKRAVKLLVAPAVIVLLALAALSALSVVWSIDPNLEALSWPLTVGGYAALASAAGVFSARYNALTPLMVGLCVAAVASAAVGLLAMLLEHAPLAVWLDGAWRPAGPLEYPPALALLQVIALPALLWAALELGGSRRISVLAALILAVTAIILSGSRLQLAFASLVLAIGLLVTYRAWQKRGIAVVAITLALFACGVAAALGLAPGQSNGSLGVDLTHGRTHTWSAALTTVGQQPWLGSGTETFELASASNQGDTAVRYAHNLPLDAWVELGIAGLILVVCLYGAVGVAVWNARYRPEVWVFGVGAVLFLATNLVDWPWHLAGVGAIWAVCLGATLVAASQPKTHSSLTSHRISLPQGTIHQIRTSLVTFSRRTSVFSQFSQQCH